MIKIVYNRKDFSVSVIGHAQSGKKGNDLVCAGVSALVYTLAADVENLCADKKHVRRPKIELAEGEAFIQCEPIHGMNALTTVILDSVCTGFELLAKQYPKNVKYKIEG